MKLRGIAKKQEEFEEKLKFKNQFKPLDEDDVEYLVSFPTCWACQFSKADWNRTLFCRTNVGQKKHGSKSSRPN